MKWWLGCIGQLVLPNLGLRNRLVKVRGLSDAPLECYRRHMMIQCCDSDKQIGQNGYSSSNSRTFLMEH